MINQLFSREFLIFLVTGGFAALVNFLSRIIYNQFVSFSSAIMLAYITGMITAFILAKLFVFKKSERKLHHSIIFFILVNGVAVIQTWLISMGLAYYLLPYFNFTWYVQELSHGVGIIVPVFSSYFGHKYWSFK